MTDEKQDEPTTGVIDPDTGKAHPNSGPSAGPEGGEGTQARDVAKNGTAGTESDDDASPSE